MFIRNNVLPKDGEPSLAVVLLEYLLTSKNVKKNRMRIILEMNGGSVLSFKAGQAILGVC